jgi:hypothetical protein
MAEHTAKGEDTISPIDYGRPDKRRRAEGMHEIDHANVLAESPEGGGKLIDVQPKRTVLRLTFQQ